jgi:GxxExxY protein
MDSNRDFSGYQHSELTGRILASALTVHASLGPGLLESTYRACLAHQLELDGMSSRREVPIPIRYQGADIDTSYRADLIVEDRVLIELKAVERLLPIHLAQVLTYLRLSDLRVGLLINFNVTRLKFGIKRLVR